LKFDVWFAAIAFASVACSADDLPVVECVESSPADGCDVVGFGACGQLVCVPCDGCPAERAFGLALLSGLDDEPLPPASVGLAGCAVGVCHHVSNPRLALYGSYLPL
jgi:lipoprotein